MRAAKTHYIASSAISIVPNRNDTSSDLAVSITRGAKLKVYYPGVIDMVDSTFQEWTMAGLNRRLADADAPYTIYARLPREDKGNGYLLFAKKGRDGTDWYDRYGSHPTEEAPLGHLVYRPDANHPEWYISVVGEYWFVRMGDVSLPDGNGQRTVTLDTGILGTEEYNAQWRLNPDDLPDNPVRTVIEDRGIWTATPQVTYQGPTGTRTPDGTLDAAVAAALGWEGTEPLTFTNGEPIAEPYHRLRITRSRWIEKRLTGGDIGLLSDAKLYQKLTTVSKGWEEENTLEISRVWRGGILWECLIESTAETPRWACTDWKEVGGDQTIYCEIQSSAGTAFRNGNVDTILTMSVRYAQEEIGQLVAYPQKTVTWKRMTGWDDTRKTFVETSADRSWTPAYTDEGRLSIVLQRSDMGNGWMTDYRRAQFVCIIDEDGPEPMMAARRIL